MKGSMSNKAIAIKLLNRGQLPRQARLRATSAAHDVDDEYQHLQRSRIPSMHFQAALPRLPIPDLKATCERYLAAQRPLLIDEAFAKTAENVHRFRDNEGKRLQAQLKKQDAANSSTSYISKLWFEKYLADRIPLPINYNPALVLHNDTRTHYNDQLVRATNLVVSSLRFLRALESDRLEPHVYHLQPARSDTPRFRTVCGALPPRFAYIAAYLQKAFPLDMSQYGSLFRTTRIPETDVDRLVQAAAGDSRHVTVQFRGNFYAVEVLEPNGEIVSSARIYERLSAVLRSARPAAEFPIGVLTTLERNRWATLRHTLLDNGNARALQLIDSAIFNVCLDEEAPGADPFLITKQFLHGDGTNRWFDKSFSLIVAKDGVTAVNFEHSWGDGVAVLRYTEEIFKDSINKPRINPDDKISPTNDDLNKSVQFLDFKLDDTLRHAIKGTRIDYASVCANVDLNVTEFKGTGKNICKSNKISPDALMQLAFQDYTLLHNATASQRPSASVLREKMFHCSELHNKLIKEAAMGQGFDRHLFALHALAKKNGIQSNIFEDPEYAHINHNVLSTSTLNSPAIYCGGFAPVVPDGFGVAYVIKDDYLGTAVSSYKNGRDGRPYIDAITQTFEELIAILRP